MYYRDGEFFANYYVCYGNSQQRPYAFELAHETELPLTLRDITDARLREVVSCEPNITELRIEIYERLDSQVFWHNRELTHRYTVLVDPDLYR